MPGKHAPGFRETVDALVHELSSTAVRDVGGEAERQSWLRTLYTAYNQRFLADNSHIWHGASIMLPLAYGLIAAVPSAMQHGLPLIFPALASTVIGTANLIIVENHRAFQDKNLAWLKAIEQVLGVTQPKADKIRGHGLLDRLITAPAIIRRLFRMLTLILILSWLLLAWKYPLQFWGCA